MQSGVSRPVSAAASGKLYAGSSSGVLYGGSASGILDFSESQPQKKLYEVKNLGACVYVCMCMCMCMCMCVCLCVCTCIQLSVIPPKKKLYAVKSDIELEQCHPLVVSEHGS
jgi:hypothetical protein